MTVHGPKIEAKRRKGEEIAAIACGGGKDQLEDDAPTTPSEVSAH